MGLVSLSSLDDLNYDTLRSSYYESSERFYLLDKNVLKKIIYSPLC